MTKRPEKTLYRPNLYLLGFMGTGKSSVGRKVAARLKLKFLDSDAEIEKSAGMQINDICKIRRGKIQADGARFYGKRASGKRVRDLLRGRALLPRGNAGARARKGNLRGIIFNA